MLILSRKAGQTIQIGDDIEVSVSEIRDGQVRLAIRAPKHIAVDRSEIRQRKLEHPRSAVELQIAGGEQPA